MATYYTPHATKQILISHQAHWVKKEGNYILNEAISFDIETTSIYQDGEKRAFMYVWMLDIFDCTIIGRTWQEFVSTLDTIVMHFNLANVKRRAIIYVHNLAYEFQFIRKWFKWYKVFSLSRRKPLYALTRTGIEFRCSYRLSGYKLEKVGELVNIPKLTNDFDYSKVRHSKTPLTPDEIKYCIHDVKIVCAYIRQKMKEDDNNISLLPLTKTGYVRRYVREYTLRGKNRCFYKNMIRSLTLETEEYLMAKRAFAGGYTHASVLHSGIECKDVTSFDFSSSYPTVLIAEKYPMTKGKKIESISKEDFYELMSNDNLCCIFTITLTDVHQTFPCESYLSESRCRKIENSVINNGRIVKADSLTTDITNVDFNIIREVYKFEISKIGHLYVYERYYLPTSFVECILHFYNVKTQLKDIEDKKTEYMNGKENLNALFGMCVTDIVRELIEYDTDAGWIPPKKLTDEEYNEFVSNQLDKENEKKGRFLYYLWGVFCTAFARRNLWTGIKECKTDYIYSDTDSVKILNYEKHKDYFDSYNKEILSKLETALAYHKLPVSLIYPKNIKGKTKPLGIWDFDGHYKRFKAVRAKSYIYQYDDDSFGMTVAGLCKRDRSKPITPSTQLDAIDYLLLHGDPIEQFKGYGSEGDDEPMKIPKEYTGKLTHTYIDEPFSIIVEDYNGIRCAVHEKSCIHLEPTSFKLTLAEAYSKYLKGVQQNIYV